MLVHGKQIQEEEFISEINKLSNLHDVQDPGKK